MTAAIIPTLWAEPLAVLAAGMLVAAGLATAVAGRRRSAAWGRTAWQAALLGALLLTGVELTGLGRGVAAWLRPARTARSRPAARPGTAPLSEPLGSRDDEGGMSPGPAGRRGAEAPAKGDGSISLPAVGDRAAPAEASAEACWWPGILWLAGTVVLLGRVAIVRLIAVAFRARCASAADEAIHRRAKAVARRVGLRRPVRVLESPRVPTPIAFGSLRPTIALPEGFSRQFDAGSQEAVLAHELSHLAGHDPAWGLLGRILTAVLWWHPLAWWARRRLTAACEAAADEASLLVAGGPERLADCLIAFGKRLRRWRPTAWVAALGDGLRSGLARRVQRLLHLAGRPPRRPRRSATALLRAAGPVVLAGVVLFAAGWARCRPADVGGPTMSTIRSSWRGSIAHALLAAAAAGLAPSRDAPAGREAIREGGVLAEAPEQELWEIADLLAGMRLSGEYDFRIEISREGGDRVVSITPVAVPQDPATAATPTGDASPKKRLAQRLRREARALREWARVRAAAARDLEYQAAALRHQARDVLAMADETADPARRARLVRGAEQSMRDADASDQAAAESACSAAAAETRAAEAEAEAARIEREAAEARARATPKAEPARPGPAEVTRVYRLKHAKPTAVVEAVGKAVTRWPKGAATAPPIKLVLDERSGSLIVAASPEMQKRIAELVAKLDVPGAEPATAPAKRRAAEASRQTRVFRLKHAKAEALARTMHEIMASWKKASPGGLAAFVVPHARTNSLIVSAPDKMAKRIADLVARLDVPPGTQPAGEGGGARYAADLAAFFAEVDGTYPFFDLKGVRKDWVATKRRLWRELKACRSDTEFLGLVLDAIRCLRDGHMYLKPAKAKFPSPPAEFCPGISFLPATKNRVVVMYPPRGHEKALKTGTIVTEIDGRDARGVLEERAKQAWSKGGFYSSPQRARLFEYRVALCGAKGQTHTLTVLSGTTKRRVALTCNVAPRGWPHTYNLPKGLTRVGRSFWYAELPSGVGYMYLRRVDDSPEPGIRKALDTHRGAKGWIVDLRGNAGGGYSGSLIRAIETMPRPVAVIIDAGCVSAGETLARDFARCADARIFGSRSAGCSSSKRSWQFPSGIATVRISIRSRWRNDRKPIEYNGIEPDEPVEAVPEDVAAGLNSAILRAERYLRKLSPATRPAG